MQPMPAVVQPSRTQARVSSLEYSLCRSHTGHFSGVPGSVRRTRAGSVVMPLILRAMDSGSSVRPMVLP